LNKSALFPASILLVILALGFHGVAHERIDEGERLKAKSLELAMKQHTRVQADPVAQRLFNSARVLNTTGEIFTVCSLICLVAARIRREPGWYLFAILLLSFDIDLLMLL
jgi:hypothetical protein